MYFLLQKSDETPLKIEYSILLNILKKDRWRYEYMNYSMEDLTFDHGLTPANFPHYFANGIPVGSIEFVSAWMQIFHRHGLNPIEIPECLRKDKYLKREYRIVCADEIPKNGAWFIKDVSQLKSFTCGFTDMSQVNFCDNGSNQGYSIDKTHYFQVSNLCEILAEYRAYFLGGKLENICNYNGDLSVFPDVNLVLEANAVYSLQDDYPESYTMDLMITKEGTSIIEIHPFTSVGLYSTLWKECALTNAYRDGINYYIKHNTEIKIDDIPTHKMNKFRKSVEEEVKLLDRAFPISDIKSPFLRSCIKKGRHPKDVAWSLIQ